MNNVCLIGNVTRDLELRRVGETKNTRFTLAVARKFKKDESDFINCIAWGKQAETLCEYVKKGHKISVVGNIRTGSYVKDERTIYTTDVIVESFGFLGRKNSNIDAEKDDINSKQENFDELTPVEEDGMPF